MNNLKHEHLNPTAVDCEQVAELLSAYAFGMTDPAETVLVEEGLKLCPQLEAELAEYRELADKLLDSQVPEQHAPGHILDNLLAAVASSEDKVSPQKRIIRWRMWFPTLAAALIMLVLGIGNIYALTRINRMEDRQDELYHKIDARDDMLTLFANEGIWQFELMHVEENQSSPGLVLCHPDEPMVIVQVANLAPDREYEVRLWREGVRVDAGELKTDQTGAGTLVFQAPEEMGSYRYLYIMDKSSPEPVRILQAKLY